MDVSEPTYDIEEESKKEIGEFHKQRFKNQKTKEKAKKKNNTNDKLNTRIVVLGTQLVISLLTGIITVILLYIFNPPITQNTRKDSFVKEGQNWKSVLFVFMIVVFITFIIPYIIKLFKLLIQKK